MSEIALDGLRADNPLAFMAALGALVTIDRRFRADGAVTMRWRPSRGTWRPCLGVPGEISAEDLTRLLFEQLHRPTATSKAEERCASAKEALKAAKERLKTDAKATKARKGTDAWLRLKECILDPAELELVAAQAALAQAQEAGGSADRTTALGDSLNKVTLADFALFLRKAAESARPDNRRDCDLAAGFGCELLPNEDGNLKPSRFSKQNGNSGKSMLRDMAILMLGTTEAQLGEALFGPWKYADKGRSLGWDPAEVRPYAYQASDPANDPATVHGANLLAYEALSLFPTAPQESDLDTTGTQRIARRLYFSWPVWTPAVTLGVVRSLLALPEIHRPGPSRGQLEPMGVTEVFRSEHFSFNKSARFRPAEAV